MEIVSDNGPESGLEKALLCGRAGRPPLRSFWIVACRPDFYLDFLVLNEIRKAIRYLSLSAGGRVASLRK